MNIVTGYHKVLFKLNDITETLKSNSDAKEKLTRLYQQEKWLDVAATPAEDELVKLALDRIKQDPNQFDLFVDMLHKTEGMDLIVKTLTGGELRCSLCLYTHMQKEFQPRPGSLLYMKIYVSHICCPELNECGHFKLNYS